MHMLFEDPKMQAYYDSLPPKVRAFLENAKVEVGSPGELMMIGEHFRNAFADQEEKGPAR